MLRAALTYAALIGLLAIVLSGCDRRIDGTWTDRTGDLVYSFSGDGRAEVSLFGANVTGQYRIDDRNLILVTPQGAVVFEISGELLIGPNGLELSRAVHPDG